MGSWAYPNTVERVRRLESLMETPVRAEGAEELLHDLIGDDSLLDNIHLAKGNDPAADVRPAIASTLEEWTRWYSVEQFMDPWEPGTRERVRELATSFADADYAGLFPRPLNPDTPDAAVAIVQNILGDDPDRPVTDYDKVRRIMPGVYAVVDPDEGTLFRVETARNLVIPAHEDVEADLKAELFGVAPALRH